MNFIFFHYRHFYPAPWLSASSTLSKPKPKEEWDVLFQDSYAVHFYASSNPGHRVNKPRFYGNSFPAYVYLGPKHCPLAFDAQRMFWIKDLAQRFSTDSRNLSIKNLLAPTLSSVIYFLEYKRIQLMYFLFSSSGF